MLCDLALGTTTEPSSHGHCIDSERCQQLGGGVWAFEREKDEEEMCRVDACALELVRLVDRSLDHRSSTRRERGEAPDESGGRGCALENPHEYDLAYGTPVPGYRAPGLTVEPASRVSLVLARLVLDVHRARELVRERIRPISKALATQVRALEKALMPGVPLWIIARALVARALLFGQINFEVVGRLDDVVQDKEALFDFTVGTIADVLGMSQTGAVVQTSTIRSK